jgi:hypothetical protein
MKKEICKRREATATIYMYSRRTDIQEAEQGQRENEVDGVSYTGSIHVGFESKSLILL